MTEPFVGPSVRLAERKLRPAQDGQTHTHTHTYTQDGSKASQSQAWGRQGFSHGPLALPSSQAPEGGRVAVLAYVLVIFSSLAGGTGKEEIGWNC